jgi:hypothetical protein
MTEAVASVVATNGGGVHDDGVPVIVNIPVVAGRETIR